MIYDVTGPPDGCGLDVGVGAGHDGHVRNWNLHIWWGSWDPIGSCPLIKYQIQVKLEQRLSTLSLVYCITLPKPHSIEIMLIPTKR